MNGNHVKEEFGWESTASRKKTLERDYRVSLFQEYWVTWISVSVPWSLASHYLAHAISCRRHVLQNCKSASNSFKENQGFFPPRFYSIYHAVSNYLCICLHNYTLISSFFSPFNFCEPNNKHVIWYSIVKRSINYFEIIEQDDENVSSTGNEDGGVCVCMCVC